MQRPREGQVSLRGMKLAPPNRQPSLENLQLDQYSQRPSPLPQSLEPGLLRPSPRPKRPSVELNLRNPQVVRKRQNQPRLRTSRLRISQLRNPRPNPPLHPPRRNLQRKNHQRRNRRKTRRSRYNEAVSSPLKGNSPADKGRAKQQLDPSFDQPFGCAAFLRTSLANACPSARPKCDWRFHGPTIAGCHRDRAFTRLLEPVILQVDLVIKHDARPDGSFRQTRN